MPTDRGSPASVSSCVWASCSGNHLRAIRVGIGRAAHKTGFKDRLIVKPLCAVSHWVRRIRRVRRRVERIRIHDFKNQDRLCRSSKLRYCWTDPWRCITAARGIHNVVIVSVRDCARGDCVVWTQVCTFAFYVRIELVSPSFTSVSLACRNAAPWQRLVVVRGILKDR